MNQIIVKYKDKEDIITFNNICFRIDNDYLHIFEDSKVNIPIAIYKPDRWDSVKGFEHTFGDCKKEYDQKMDTLIINFSDHQTIREQIDVLCDYQASKNVKWNIEHTTLDRSLKAEILEALDVCIKKMYL